MESHTQAHKRPNEGQTTTPRPSASASPTYRSPPRAATAIPTAVPTTSAAAVSATVSAAATSTAAPAAVATAAASSTATASAAAAELGDLLQLGRDDLLGVRQDLDEVLGEACSEYEEGQGVSAKGTREGIEGEGRKTHGPGQG